MRSRSIPCRLAGVLGLAAISLTLVSIGPADARDRDGRHDRGRGERHYGRYGGYRGWQGGYYAPPPVIYQPYGYQSQPGASINLNFPLRFR